MTTFHALERAKERTDYNAKSSERFIANAIKRGKGAENFGLKERDYLQRKESEGYRALMYNSFCFIVNDEDRCVTMYSAPKWFRKKHYDGKREIKNAKKYARYYNLFEREETEYGLCQVS